MLRRSSTNSSTSSRLSRDDDRIINRRNSRKGDSQRLSLGPDSGNRFSQSSSQRRPIYDEEKASFYDSCRTIYLMVFDDTKEEVTSPEELTLLLQYAGQNPTKKAISRKWGKNTDSMTFYQFCDLLKEEKPMSRNDLMRAFKKIDINGDGYITHDELQNVMTMHGERMTKSEVRALMEDSDFNGDGRLDYSEFCDMMLATANKFSNLQNDSKRKEKTKVQVNRDSGRGKSVKSKKESIRSDSRKSIALEEKRPTSSSSKKLSKRLNDSSRISNDNDNSIESTAPKLIKEPVDLSKWRYKNMKGSFHIDEDGTIESHQYRLLVLEETEIFINVQALTPKYGKFGKELFDSDITVFLMEEGRGGKLVAFSEAKIDQKFCLQAHVHAGSYQLLTFTSGVILFQNRDDSENASKLVIGEDDNAKFTKACRETLFEIFYRCDLDGNGFLSRIEFNQFQMKTSGEGCDDDAWEVVKENFEMNNREEITPDGFLKLNMMEAKDPDGGVDELWVTLESMGYNKALQLVKAFPFQIEVFTRKGDSALEVVGISNGGKPLEDCLIASIKSSGLQRPFDQNKNIILYTCENVTRTSLAVENKAYVPMKIRLRCNQSRNAQSKQENLDFVCNLDSKELQIIDHLIPKKKNQEVKVICEEFILK